MIIMIMMITKIYRTNTRQDNTPIVNIEFRENANFSKFVTTSLCITKMIKLKITMFKTSYNIQNVSIIKIISLLKFPIALEDQYLNQRNFFHPPSNFCEICVIDRIKLLKWELFRIIFMAGTAFLPNVHIS